MFPTRLIFSFVRIIVLVALTSTIGFSQREERSIDKVSSRFEPVQVVKLKFKEKPVEFGQALMDDDDDWFKGQTVTIKNVTDQAIARIELQLTFPREEQPYVVFMHYGKDPAERDAAAVKQVLPDETVDIKLNELNVPVIQRTLRRLGYPQKIGRAQIQVRSVTFADGSMWSGDLMLYPDPAQPTRKINPRRIDVPFKARDPDGASIRWKPRDSLSFRFHHPTLFDFAPRLNLKRWIYTPVQSPQPCTLKIFLLDDDVICFNVLDFGCKYKEDVFLPLLPFNTRPNSVTVQCATQSADIICEGSEHTTILHSTCGEKVAGTCGGSSSGGCNSGFTDLGGYCGRSYTFQSHCAGPTYYDEESCSCPDGWEPSPIIIDVDGSGFSMTDGAGGVVFDFLNDGVPLQIPWTAASSTNAFLVLDRNGNGTIDNGMELFGDLTPQPASQHKNGFIALAEYDKPEKGGNRDGVIGKRDMIFDALRLWQDRDHNGISVAGELHTLKNLGLKSIDLDYKESARVDQYGNYFRYRSAVKDTHDAQLGRWAWDVFLKVQ